MLKFMVSIKNSVVFVLFNKLYSLLKHDELYVDSL
jgi:hypothetical protein